MDQRNLKETLLSLCALMSVSGFESRSADLLREGLRDCFDTVTTDGVGNHLFVRRCGREGAPLVMVDTHFDEIGMLVRAITDEGFLRLAPVGGLSPAVLQGADVVVWGRRPLRGVITSTPPHLRSSEDDRLSEAEELFADVGYGKEELEAIVSVGTPVGFAPSYGELLNRRLMGKGFDNKACAAAALYAIAHTPKEALAADVALCLSAYEETSRLGGVTAAAFGLSPDYAMVIDVNFAMGPGLPKWESVPMGKGVSLAWSAATHRGLTEQTEALCRRLDIPHCRVAAPSSTGTNSATLGLVGRGIPVVDVGLPLSCMHTYNEVVSMEDVETLCRLIEAFLCDEAIAKAFAGHEIIEEGGSI